MTTETSSRSPFLAAGQPTLADAMVRLEADESLAPARRRDLVSALNCLARIIGSDPAGIPAHPRFLRGRMKDIIPAAHDVRATRWSNVRSLVTAALRHLGLAALPGRYTAPLTPAWQGLWGALPPGKGLRGNQIRKMVKRRLGIAVNPHLFRHAGAKFYLDEHPGAYALVARVLGHRSVDTTMQYYTGLESAAAVRQFNKVILGLRDDKDPSPSGPPAKSGRRRRKPIQ
jgi:hypothetical protein